ncbi:hypothetical protein [Aureibacillus halotolerans]|uniref:Uncharacterized protein n=1 Tax=Aureibacillus halotolerans TaxID=1508390 RepID=A0A4R6TWX2_9BACI|nr:hypothetical protein [Aureibacillus halotolerans]TDQ36773.1 hypothetical protein EV213_11672 [Aureibacillus halotolerans]
MRQLLKRYPILFLFPLLWDLIAIGVSYILFVDSNVNESNSTNQSIGAWVGFSPLSDLLTSFNIEIDITGFPMLLVGIASLTLYSILYAFFNAGYIGLLYEAHRADVMDSPLRRFIHYGKTKGFRLFLFEMLFVLIIFASVFIFGLLSLIPLLGILLAIGGFIGFIVLRFKFIYYECTLVIDDYSLRDAIQTARDYSHFRTYPYGWKIALIIIASMIFGSLSDQNQPGLALVVIAVIYNIIMPFLQYRFVGTFFHNRANYLKHYKR